MIYRLMSVVDLYASRSWADLRKGVQIDSAARCACRGRVVWDDGVSARSGQARCLKWAFVRGRLGTGRDA
jgi:hypothetical protein